MNYYNEIKTQLINNEVYKRVKDYSKNRSDLMTYYNVGKLLIEAQGGEDHAKYGNQLIKEYSKKLSLDIGFEVRERVLWRTRKFYLMFANEKVSTLSTQLSWSHYVELLSLNDINIVNYYITICEQQNLSIRQLRERIINILLNIVVIQEYILENIK